MNKVLMFDNPNDFLTHLKNSLEKENTLSQTELISLLKGSVSALEQLWTSQNILVTKMAETVEDFDLRNSLWQMKDEFSDVAIKCSDQKVIRAHKIILSG